MPPDVGIPAGLAGIGPGDLLDSGILDHPVGTDGPVLAGADLGPRIGAQVVLGG